MKTPSQIVNSLILIAFCGACGSKTQPVAPLKQSQESIHEGYRLPEGDPVRQAMVYLLAMKMGVNPKTKEAAPMVFFCSGVLIAKNKVLTAAHCMTGKPDARGEGFGEDFSEGDTTKVVFIKGVEKVESPIPGLDGFPELPYIENNFDVAVITLPEDAPAGFEPLPIATPELMRSAKERSFKTVGFGLDEKGGIGLLKACDIPESAVLQHEVESVLSGTQPNYTYQCSNGSIDHGDSGGPMIATLDGKPYVIGVNHGIFVSTTPEEKTPESTPSTQPTTEPSTEPTTQPTTQPAAEPTRTTGTSTDLLAPELKYWLDPVRASLVTK